METVFLKERDLIVLANAKVTFTEMLHHGYVSSYVVKGDSKKGYSFITAGMKRYEKCNVAVEAPVKDGYSYMAQD
jgi:hypothetical protein